ncbi:MAG: hypothetical protein H7Y08_06255 [Rhizobiaceae bacterium]|nr:hypothetical protein [Rhizobiaceae bacterium]
MTQLSEALFSGDGPETAAKIVRRLDELAIAVDGEIKSGAAPDRFSALTAVAASLASARSIMIPFTK